jgi:hypothetical protein
LRNANTLGVIVCASLALALLMLRLQGAAPRVAADEYREAQTAQGGSASPGPTSVTPTQIGQVGAPATSSPGQDLANQIAAVADQVAATAKDATVPADLKAQLIDTLAAQFNQLVSQWQQSISGVSIGGPQPANPSVIASPSPAPSPLVGASPVPVPSQAPGAP